MDPAYRSVREGGRDPRNFAADSSGAFYAENASTYATPIYRTRASRRASMCGESSSVSTPIWNEPDTATSRMAYPSTLKPPPTNAVNNWIPNTRKTHITATITTKPSMSGSLLDFDDEVSAFSSASRDKKVPAKPYSLTSAFHPVSPTCVTQYPTTTAPCSGSVPPGSHDHSQHRQHYPHESAPSLLAHRCPPSAMETYRQPDSHDNIQAIYDQTEEMGSRHGPPVTIFHGRRDDDTMISAVTGGTGLTGNTPSGGSSSSSRSSSRCSSGRRGHVVGDGGGGSSSNGNGRGRQSDAESCSMSSSILEGFPSYPTPQVELLPGVYEPLRTAKETCKAIAQDFFVPSTCVTCEASLFCIQDSKYVLCPHCRVVGPLTGRLDSGHVNYTNGSLAAAGAPTIDNEQGRGVGLGFTYEQLCSWQGDIIRKRTGRSRRRSSVEW